MTTQKLIVVGVDGSESATAALRWACGEATSTGAIIEVVHAFRPDLGSSPLDGDARARSSRLLSREVWVALALIDDPPRIRLSSQAGGAAAVLISRSAQAGLLVLGAAQYTVGDADRSGSTAAICQQNAPCPIAIITRLGQPDPDLAAPQLVPEQRPDDKFPRYSLIASPGSYSIRSGVSRRSEVNSRPTPVPTAHADVA